MAKKRKTYKERNLSNPCKNMLTPIECPRIYSWWRGWSITSTAK
jgi:hypothetical protein